MDGGNAGLAAVHFGHTLGANLPGLEGLEQEGHVRSRLARSLGERRPSVGIAPDLVDDMRASRQLEQLVQGELQTHRRGGRKRGGYHSH